MSRSKTTETHLIRLAQQGELDAFNRLVLDSQDSLYNLACRVLGDESAAQQATQLAFGRAFQSLGSYRLDLWQARYWRAWLFRWLVQACRSLACPERIGGQSLHEQSRQPLLRQQLLSRQLLSRQLLSRQRLRQQYPPVCPGSNVALALCSLPLDLRLVVALVDVSELDYEEAALAFDISPAKVKSRLARARQQLSLQVTSAG